MRILAIFNLNDQDLLHHILIKHNVAAHENIIFVSNFEQAKEFILNHLVNNHQHIDLIITADKLYNNLFDVHLVDWLRYSQLDYSFRNFKLNALPVILYDKEIRSSDYYLHGFDATVERNSYGQHHHFLSVIELVVTKSRARVLDDLELLKLKLDDLQSRAMIRLDSHYIMKIKSDPYHWAGRTQVLSEAFIRNPRRLQYDWLENEKQKMERDIDEYESIIKKLHKYNKVHSEKRVLHALYNNAPWILRQDLFRDPIYEPSLMKNSSEYEEPDYLLPSAFPGIIPTNITEVKPHIFPVLHRRKRKPGFRQPFNDGLIQVSDYERYTRTRKGREEINGLLDYKESNFTFTLLASNEEEMNINKKRVEELGGDHFPKIKMETHNYKLDQAILFYERFRKGTILRN